MTFDAPNFTQVPNFYLEHCMMQVTPAENLTMLAIFRYTSGFLRREGKISLSYFEKLTGLSRQGVVNCIKTLENKGWIKVLRRERQTSVYELIIKESDIVNSVDQPSQLSRLPLVNSVDPSKKEKKEKENNNPASSDSKGEARAASRVVVFSELDALPIPESEKIRISKEYAADPETIARAAKFVSEYKDARSPIAVLRSALNNPDWECPKTEEETLEKNRAWANSKISKLEDEKIGPYTLKILRNHIEFVGDGAVVPKIFCMKSPVFKQEVCDFANRARKK